MADLAATMDSRNEVEHPGIFGSSLSISDCQFSVGGSPGGKSTIAMMVSYKRTTIATCGSSAPRPIGELDIIDR